MDLTFIAFLMFCCSWCLLPISYAVVPDPFAHPADRLRPSELHLVGLIDVNGTSKAIIECGHGRLCVGQGDCIDGWTVTSLSGNTVVLSNGGSNQSLRMEE